MNKNTNDFVSVFELGPRDGLQNIDQNIPTQKKIKLINALSECGFKKIETTSFVSPKWVPQLSDAESVMRDINRNPDVKYTALVPNIKGYDKAVLSKADEIAIFVSASEGFSHANLNCSIKESITRLKPIAEKALEQNIPVRGYLSSIIACPFDGLVNPEQVSKIAHELLQMGCYEVSLGDTIGAGNKQTVAKLLDVLLDNISPDQLAGHFHDTNNTALEMISKCVARGMRTFDSSIAGLGGCPYAPGSSGNVDTRDVVYLLNSMGLSTGIDLTALKNAEKIAFDIKYSKG